MDVKRLVVLGLALVGLIGCGSAQDAYMGDWTGTLKVDGKEQTVVVNMIPTGNGNYDAKFLSEFDKRVPTLYMLRGRIANNQATLIDAMPLDATRVTRATDDGIVFDASLWKGKFADGVLEGTISGNRKGSFTLKQLKRVSPTLGKQAPAGATVLFDGKGLDLWSQMNGKPSSWKLLDGGVMEVSGGDIRTKETFSNYRLHVEFKLAYMPTASGQGRSNSGVYQQGRYEVQVLDSFGLVGEDNECGGIYHVAKPACNMCFPPLSWQTYDITFTQAKLDEAGKKVANAKLTVNHNGVNLFDNLEIPTVTGGSMDNKEGTPGPIRLQDHGNPVQYRNIWIEKLP